MTRLLLLSVLLLALAPAAAHATLVFDREPLKPAVWIADDDGSNAHKLAAGSQPRIAPDGKTVAFLRIARSGLDLMTVPADGSAAPRVLAKRWRGVVPFAWSADSRTIVTAVGPDVGAKRLVLLDVATGQARTVASGFFDGATLAPDGSTGIYNRHRRDTRPPRPGPFHVPGPG